MRRFRHGWLGLLLLVFAGTLRAGEWRPDHWFDQPRSPRIANYRIQAALDWERKTLEGRETITWRNAGKVATREFPLHLYLNAFKGPQSRFYRESGRELSSDPKDWGYCRLLRVALEGEALEGYFGEDETVYWVKLPRAVAPGETIRVDIQWESRFPRAQARTGWAGHFLMGAQWFPKVGVYQGEAWTCAAYHAHTEFFSDFGVYDVELSLPNALLLAHSGTSIPHRGEDGVERDAAPDPARPLNAIWKLHAEDVHDFAWAVMPQRSWGYTHYDYRKVQIFYYGQGENRSNLDRQHEAVKAAMRLASEWCSPYPYPTLTVLDVPKEAKAVDGMEYPTLITAGSLPFDPFQQRGVPEGVSIHEFGHQYFYGMVASNEVDEPWLDEGLTSWFTRKVMQRTYQSLWSSRRFQMGAEMVEWVQYWTDPSVDPLTQKGHRMRDGDSYQRTAYAKPTLVLDQLEALLGRPVMEEIIRAYATEMAFKHPTAADFRRIAERVSGRDLSAFWRDFVEGTDTLDYVIRSVDVLPVLQGGWLESPQGPRFAVPQSVAPGRRGSLTLERRGGLKVPITLWVRLEDRSEQRLLWEGQDRWITYEFESPVVAAVLDPDGNYPMLKDRLHGVYSQTPTQRGFHYWSQMAWGLVTALLQGIGLA
ncbi:MAG: M1 family metallopeptidase [Firmicutes bacterium]|nr:M1 family metallopeptidase [Bacillota bacterium]